jgi:hypothetical protein
MPTSEAEQVTAGPTNSPASETEAAPPTKKTVAAKPKAARRAKAGKGQPRPSQAARARSKTGKLVCRYCGSDDLAPSFIKRRDARCRACFKQRYGSAVRSAEASRPRKASAAE